MRIPVEKLADLKHDILARRTGNEKKDLGVRRLLRRTLSTMTIRKVHSRGRKGMNFRRRLPSEVVQDLYTNPAQFNVSRVLMANGKKWENAARRCGKENVLVQ